MKGETIIWVYHDTWGKLAQQVREALIAVNAECFTQGSDSYYSRLRQGDPRLESIVSVLTGAGLKPWRQLDTRRSDEFTLVHVRHHHPKDLDELTLLEPMGNPTLHDYCAVDEHGVLWIKPSLFRKQRLVADGDIHSLVVSTDIRTALETQGFRGLAFKPVKSRKPLPSGVSKNLWELTPDQRLPPLSGYRTFFDQHGNPVQGSAESAYQYREGYFSRPELHYAASALKDWMWTDFALTHELFWYSERRHRRRLVTSKRFYDFCRNNKLKMDWLPVRIDPE